MFNKYTYLYVEDDALSREVMQAIMAHGMGITSLIVFENAMDFMIRMKSLSTQPDIIMLDIHLSPHNGFELLKILRADPDYAQTRVIALTASVMNEEVEKLRQSGFNGAISKPLSIRTFPALMDRVIHGEAVWHIT